MAISSRTDWSKIRYSMFVLFSISALLASTVANGLTTSGKQKRQLFREHLLPQQGGKIPAGAFDPDRLNLNRLNQNGVYSPDGLHLQQRHPDSRHHPKQYLPNTLQIHLHPDNRYVALPGRDYSPQTLDTTYLIREPVNYVIYPPLYRYTPLPLTPDVSLKLLHHFRFDKVNNQEETSWNDIFPSKILAELAPYLRSLDYKD